MYVDPDQADPQLNAELVRLYRDSARRLKQKVLNPPGRSENSQLYNQARAASMYSQVQQEIRTLKQTSTKLVGQTLQAALDKGKSVAAHQLKVAGISQLAPEDLPTNPVIAGSFTKLNRSAIKVLAQDTVGDLHKAADSMGKTAGTLLRKMSATGVTTQQVNQIIAGRAIIDGQPAAAARELKNLLQKVHGETVTVPDKNGDPRTFKVGDYAEMVTRTKTREAVCRARHQELADQGYDLVIIVGKRSKYYCSLYLGKVFSISGTSTKYPPLSSLPGGTGPYPPPPFHPNCSKSTAPFIDKLSSAAALEAGAPDETTNKFLNTNDRAALQKRYQNSNMKSMIDQRQEAITADIRAKARAAGYSPPQYGGKD